jgi:hypothetical protein
VARSQICVNRLLHSPYLSVRPSVLPSAWNNSAHAGWIFVKFTVWVPFENLSIKFKVHLILTRMTGNLHGDVCTVEPRLSGLIGTAIHPDMQKIWIIGIFFEYSIYFQSEVGKKLWTPGATEGFLLIILNETKIPSPAGGTVFYWNKLSCSFREPHQRVGGRRGYHKLCVDIKRFNA